MVTDKLKDGNSPDRDLVVGYWIKRNTCLRQKTFDIYQRISCGEVNIPEWLLKQEQHYLLKIKTHMILRATGRLHVKTS